MLIRFRRNKKNCSRLVNSCTRLQSKLYFRKQDVSVNKRYRIPKWQSKTDNRENMATQGTQDEEKKPTKTQYNTICVGHHYTQTSTNKT